MLIKGAIKCQKPLKGAFLNIYFVSLEQYIWFAKISVPDLGFHQFTVFLLSFFKRAF